jgi:hypothetical protein
MAHKLEETVALDVLVDELTTALRKPPADA